MSPQRTLKMSSHGGGVESRKDKSPKRGKLWLWIQKDWNSNPHSTSCSHVITHKHTLPHQPASLYSGDLLFSLKWRQLARCVATVHCILYTIPIVVITMTAVPQKPRKESFKEKMSAKCLKEVWEDRDWNETTRPLEILTRTTFRASWRQKPDCKGLSSQPWGPGELASALPSRTLAERKREGCGSTGRVRTVRVLSDARPGEGSSIFHIEYWQTQSKKGVGRRM